MQVNSAQVQVDMAVEDLQTARQTGDERKIREAEEKVQKAEEKVEKAKEEVQKVQEKAICCTASVWSQFFQKMQK